MVILVSAPSRGFQSAFFDHLSWIHYVTGRDGLHSPQVDFRSLVDTGTVKSPITFAVISTHVSRSLCFPGQAGEPPMLIVLNCPGCERRDELDGGLAGKTLRCKQIQSSFLQGEPGSTRLKTTRATSAAIEPAVPLSLAQCK